jgi:predicted amidohydrolase
MGICICYDIRFTELSRIMALEGANIIIVPGAFNMTTGPAHWEILFRTRALDNQVYTIGVAPARQQYSNYISYGNSIAVSPWGKVLTRLSEKEEIAYCDIDLKEINKVRKQLPILAHRRSDIYTLKRKE